MVLGYHSPLLWAVDHIDAHAAAAEFFEDAIVGNFLDESTSPWLDYSCGVG